ncbi:MAG: diguanylate cyclase [Clostridia bacterium]
MNIDSEILKQIIFWSLDLLVCGTLGALLYKFTIFGKMKEQKNVKKQAYTDPLTGRGNRHLFLSIMDTLIKKKKKFAVCFLDLDGFKQINDTMGHDAGDELLIALSKTFETKLPKNAIAYRLGGDEFAIVIEDVKTTEDISILLDNLKLELKEPFIIDNTDIALEYSMGIAIYPEDAQSRQQLIMYADDAMYHIKEHGKNDYYFHNKALRARLENKTKMEKDLKIAYEQDQFGFSLQPRIDISNVSKVCFEALLYWKHPVLGKINSEFFIKQADDMGLTIKLDQYVLNNICKILVELNKKGFNNLQVAVNISNRHSVRKEFIDKLCEIINSYSIKKGALQIELTNRIDIKKIEDYKLMFERLKSCGVDIIINNFEITNESMNLFKDLPIDELKVSSKFISDESGFSKSVLKDIIKLGQDMKYKVIVGQIDDEKELIESIHSSANKLQGDFLFKKMDDSFAEEFLSAYSTYKSRIDNIISNAKSTTNKK